VLDLMYGPRTERLCQVLIELNVPSAILISSSCCYCPLVQPEFICGRVIALAVPNQKSLGHCIFITSCVQLFTAQAKQMDQQSNNNFSMQQPASAQPQCSTASKQESSNSKNEGIQVSAVAASVPARKALSAAEQKVQPARNAPAVCSLHDLAPPMSPVC
jgi:hypothetical protein